MECNFGDTVACMPQFWDWLEDWRGKDDEMSRGMWKAVKTKAREVRMAEVEKESEKRRSEKKKRRKNQKEKG